jgi:hypothetical protein
MRMKLWSGNLKTKDSLEDLRIDEKMILKLILKTQCLWVWNGLSWLGIVSCEHGNEPLGSTKNGEFLLQLRYYQIL